jgi:amino acid transporter
MGIHDRRDTHLHESEGNASGERQPALKRSLSLPLLTFYGLGNILGAGIYVLIGKVAAHAGYQAPLSFLLAAMLAVFTAFSYAELSARYPFSAGEVIYIHRGLGIRVLSILVGLLIIVTGIVSAATIARGFVGYLQVFVPISDVVAIVGLIVCLGGLAAWGISQSIAVATLMTLVEIGGLLLIIWVARPEMGALADTLRSLSDWQGLDSAQGIFLGAFLAFFAFIGFEDMVNVAEEVHKPQRTLPLAILLALGLSTLIYITVAVVSIGAVSPQQLAASEAPLAYVYQQVRGADPVLITAISLVAVVNGALIQIIMASRVCYGMGRKGWMPMWLARVNPVTRTPLVATVLITAVILMMALWLPIESLARSTSFFILLVFALINLSLWRIKQLRLDEHEGFSVYQWVPALGAFGSLLFVVLQLLTASSGSR